MKTARLVGWALALLLLVMPLAVLAQDDDEPEFEEYVSEDGLLTLRYPVGWFVSEPEDSGGFPGVGIMNSEEALARFEEGEDIEPGDAGVVMFVLPLDFLDFFEFGSELPEDPSLLEVAEIIAAAFGEVPEDATEEDVETYSTGEVEEVELDDEVAIAVIPFAEEAVEGEYIIRLLGSDLALVVISAAGKGEFDDEQRDLARHIAASVAYEGTADDVMGAMMGAPAMEEAPAGDDLTSLDGAALVEERCTVCHTRERIDNQDKDETGWTATVDRMIGYGARLNSAEREAVIDYLVATH